MMINKTILILLSVIVYVGVAVAQDGDHWQGVYMFDEESLDMRTSSWFRLEVKDVDGRLVGIYSEGINGQAVRRFQLSVKTMGTRAIFYYDRWLPRVEGVNETCTESEFASGDLMFELEEQPRHCKTEIITVWRKINLASRTETGGMVEGLFFRRSFG